MSLDDEIGKARERHVRQSGAPTYAGSAFDDAVALLRPKLDAANAEIAEKDAEIARLEAIDAECEERRIGFAGEVDKAMSEAAVQRERAEIAEAVRAESRTVSDAQRTKMLAALEACVRHHADAPCSAACAASVWDEWRAAIMCMPVEQPAAEDVKPCTVTDAQRKLDAIAALPSYEVCDGGEYAGDGKQMVYARDIKRILEQPAEGATL